MDTEFADHLDSFAYEANEFLPERALDMNRQFADSEHLEDEFLEPFIRNTESEKFLHDSQVKYFSLLTLLLLVIYILFYIV